MLERLLQSPLPQQLLNPQWKEVTNNGNLYLLYLSHCF